MKDYLFYIGAGTLLLLIVAQLSRILSRKALAWSQRRQKTSLAELNQARQKLAAARQRNSKARIDYEVT